MSRILVAVDFSEASRPAFRSALELSRALDAPLHVVHVVSTLSYGTEAAQMLFLSGPGTAAVEIDLQDFIFEEFKGSVQDFARIDFKVLHGLESEQIFDEARRWNASLIVVGSHGLSGMKKLFLGSISSRVLSRAALPVLVVHPEGQSRPERILAAIDGGIATEGALSMAGAWAAALGAELQVLHVMPELPEPTCLRLYPDSDLRPALRALLERIRQDVEEAVNRAFPEDKRPALEFRVGAPYREICAQAQEGAFDLVVVGAHRPHGFLDLANTASRVAQGCPCPVLIARPTSDTEETS